MGKIGFIEVVALSPDEKENLRKRIASACSTLKAESVKRGISVRELRRRLAGGFFKNSALRKAIVVLQELEPVVLSGYIKEAYVLVRAFHQTNAKKTHLSENDWLQEASLAMVDAMYGFDGSTELSTYIYCAVKRRLISVAGKQQCLRGIGSKMIKLRSRFKKLLENHTHEEALSDLRESGEPEFMLSNLIHASVEVFTDDMDCYDFRDDEDRQKCIAEMRFVINDTNLSEAERSVINAYLDTDPQERGWQTRLGEKCGVSKQYINFVFRRACKKILEHEKRLKRREESLAKHTA
jgi:DNA-directed RNA polymerase specialized sigma24 family protein